MISRPSPMRVDGTLLMAESNQPAAAERQDDTKLNASQYCDRCETDLADDEQFARYRVCSTCGHHHTMPALEFIQALVDHDSFDEFNRNLVSVDPLVFSDRMPYRHRVAEARKATGLTEAVVTGTGRIRGHQVILAVMDFRFLGGSMGSVVGEKVALAFERARDKRIPIITIAASGGARMQEGMLSLVQMAKTAAAAKRAHDSHVPYISVLTHPTTGGMYASFANQGDIILAEPEALIGFAGPRVVKQVSGRETIDSHTAEFLHNHGFVDGIVSRPRLRDTLATMLRVVNARAEIQKPERADKNLAPREALGTAWDAVQIARHPGRPTTLDYIKRISSQFIELHGDRLYGDDPAVVGGLGEIAGRGVMFIGQERRDEDGRRGGQALPEGYRKAIRLMQLADRLQIPIVTFVDTPGAFLGDGAEERGIAIALSESLATMSVVRVPTIAIVIGEGGSGGALAMGVADRVLMLDQAIYSVIAPEGAAAILFRDASRAPEVANSLKITAADCQRLGVVDVVVPEPEGGAHQNPEFAAALLRDSLLREMSEIIDKSPEKLVRDRYRKFRRMGQHNTHFREIVSREAGEFGQLVGRGLGKIRDHLPFVDDSNGKQDIDEDDQPEAKQA
jgi:acyl-CoA carboxylase subunit beta